MLVSSKCIRALPTRRIASRCLLHTLRNEPPLRSNHVFSRSPRVPHNRGAKRKASAKLDELPQGTIPLEPLALEDQEPALPTVLLQARSNMRNFENCVLLTRVGGFYELYFEHADEFGPLLNLKVAPKSTGPRTNPVIVSMAGFPFFQLDRYLKILVQDLNRYVAVAEEFRNDPSGKVKAGGLLNDRKVTRIITPGTLIDENFMDPFTNNYVLAIHAGDNSQELSQDQEMENDPPSFPQQSDIPLGLAWLDLSTGHFFTQFTTLSSLPSLLSRIGPREIVLGEDLQASKDHGIFTVLAEDRHLITYCNPSEVKSIKDWSPMLESPIITRIANDFTPEEEAAGSTLLQYVGERLQGSNMKLQPPTRQLDMMAIDKNTMRALEIKKTMRDDLTTGSLLHVIRRTVTKGGARLLDNWLSSPSTSLDVINYRLDLVTHMLHNELLREHIVILLKRSHDSHRLLQKFAFGRGDPDDMLGLASTVHATQELVTTLIQDSSEEDCVRNMAARINLDGPSELASRIKAAIDEEGIVQQHMMEDGEVGEIQALAEAIVTSEGSREDANILPKRKKKPTGLREYYSDDNEAWIMKPIASPTLEDLKTRLEASTLTLRFTPGLGHICHVKGKDIKRDLAEGRRVSSSKSTSSFHHPEWTNLGGRLDRCRDRIRAEEQRVFRDLREHVIHNIVKLRRNAVVLNELDIASSFATLAAEKGWTRPSLNNSTTHKIIGGRHPTVEGGLEVEGRTFTTNDCFVGDSQKIWLITGPNMAGKSTFLRQNALITILAQVGSYVPASYAELGIVDQIFSRVGSADNLYRDQSTFMVEMLETATILKHATPRSFVVMDEIGRGTTPADGTAVAYACLHHLYHVNKCRTLFATHFHGLADMAREEDMQGVGCYCTNVEEDGAAFRYVHKLREGVNRRSHALKVAKLAGLPEEAIAVARKVLERNGGSV
ncbi:MutS protein-like protein [Lachnellula subtilissima]|uniref:MutS protein-like protein n=1 Tax=Lachnellula subtilissima TaxID=602034 RepID=A0A8H8UAC6_9HELO|nr:MutS protein-like protein [Lachnellula subtilissima]